MYNIYIYLCIHTLYFSVFKISGGVKCTTSDAIEDAGAPIWNFQNLLSETKLSRYFSDGHSTTKEKCRRYYHKLEKSYIYNCKIHIYLNTGWDCFLNEITVSTRHSFLFILYSKH